jgi:hypothetical protein
MEIQTTSAPQKSVSARRLMRHCFSLILVGLLAGATAAKTQQGDRRIADLVQAGKVRVGLFPSFFTARTRRLVSCKGSE